MLYIECGANKNTRNAQDAADQAVEVRELSAPTIPPLEGVHTVKGFGNTCDAEILCELIACCGFPEFPVAAGEINFLRRAVVGQWCGGRAGGSRYRCVISVEVRLQSGLGDIEVSQQFIVVGIVPPQRGI